MMFSVPRPENDDHRYRELAVSGHDGIRLVSVRHDPLDRVTAYVFAFDDGPPGAELDCLDEENDVPFGSLDCTALVTFDGLQGWTWSDSDEAHREVPHEATCAERGASSGGAACPARAPGLTARET